MTKAKTKGAAEIAEMNETYGVTDTEDRGNDALIGDDETLQKKELFLDALSRKLSVYHACRSSGLSRATIYRWRDSDPVFAKRWEHSQDDALDALEDSLYERAMTKDTIAGIFLLKGNRPDKYQDRVKAEVNHTGSPLILTPSELDERLRSTLGDKPH